MWPSSFFFSFYNTLAESQPSTFLREVATRANKTYQTAWWPMTIFALQDRLHQLFPLPENIQASDIYQLIQESWLDTSAVSITGAVWVAQRMPRYTRLMKQMYGDLVKEYTWSSAFDPRDPFVQLLAKTASSYERCYALRDGKLPDDAPRNKNFYFEWKKTDRFVLQAQQIDPSFVPSEEILTTLASYDIFKHIVLSRLASYYHRTPQQFDMVIDLVLKWDYIRWSWWVPWFLEFLWKRRGEHDLSQPDTLLSGFLHVALEYRHSWSDPQRKKYTTLYPFWIMGAYEPHLVKVDWEWKIIFLSQ